MTNKKSFMKKILLFSLLTFLFSLEISKAEFIVPSLPSTPVYDEVGLLKSEEKTALEQQILTLEKETNHQIGIAIIKSLQGRTVEEVWLTLLRGWWIGQKWLDNGLLILLMPVGWPGERDMRIEVWKGLEGVITDLMSRRIIDENFTPHFIKGKYAEGLHEGIERMTPLLRGEVVTLPENKVSDFEDIQGILMIVAVFGWWLLSVLSASKSWWLGGVFWAIIGFFVMWTIGVFLIGIFGLILDFFLSKFAYGKIPFLRSMGNNRWWGGGWFGWGGSSGGWGGFWWGSGWGGGSSGKW